MATKGYRRGTRHLFSRRFRKKGMIKLSTYMKIYKVGDYVDIKVNGAVHKGMPYKFYHGRTGRVFNISKRAVGVEVSKQVRNRIINKRIHVRVEHVNPSRCREDFYARLKEIKAKRRAAHEEKRRILPGELKRKPAQPREGRLVKMKGKEVEDLEAIPYAFLG